MGTTATTGARAWATTDASSGADGLRRAGKALRGPTPRRSLGEWRPAPDRADPVDLLAADNAGRLPDLAPIRIGRMLTDPFAFLRGSAPVMAHDLGNAPRSGIVVQACGDAHLMNFGAFATAERNLVFDLNDFDETHPGAWEWDVARLTTSFVVAARVGGFDEHRALDAARTAAASYRARMAELGSTSVLERRSIRLDVEEVLDTVRVANGSGSAAKLERAVRRTRRRDRFGALDRFTEMRDGRPAIVAAPPLVQPLPVDAFRDDLLDLYARYRDSLPNHVSRVLDDYEFVDLALKVVGVGSVGTRALMAFFVGRVDGDPLFLQIKEAGPSVLAPHAPTGGWSDEGQRVVDGQRLMQAAGDMFLGWGHAGGRSYYLRQLRDMKGSLDLDTVTTDGLGTYAGYCGIALANAHARSQHPVLISGYLGTGERFDDAVVRFARRAADQTERDHQTLGRAVAAGRIAATHGI